LVAGTASEDVNKFIHEETRLEAPGWFQRETLLYYGFGTTPRVIASQSGCPPN